MIVMLGGPTMNLIIFLVLFTVLVTTLGTPHRDATTTVGGIEKCLVAANSTYAQQNKCPPNPTPTPAYGTLQPGDRFVSVNGVPIKSWNQLTSIIRPSTGKPLSVVVERHGRQVPLTVTPVANKTYVNPLELRTVGFLGIETKFHDYYEAVPITAVPGKIGDQIQLGVDALGRYPEKIKSLWQTIFEGKKRDPNGAVGVVGIGRLSGDFAKSTLLSLQDKVFVLINLLAGVNLLLFFFNLLPLLPLDGGHVAGALVEAAKRGRARLRARRNPEAAAARGQIFVDTAQMLPIMYAVASVLVVLTLLTLYADIVKPINVGG
jgi:membrane-associated protease RseP (regulator of RpoE activity)